LISLASMAPPKKRLTFDASIYSSRRKGKGAGQWASYASERVLDIWSKWISVPDSRKDKDFRTIEHTVGVLQGTQRRS